MLIRPRWEDGKILEFAGHIDNRDAALAFESIFDVVIPNSKVFCFFFTPPLYFLFAGT